MQGTFLFVDVAGFTALTETHGDQAAADLALTFAAMVRDVLGEAGTLAGTVGDAVFVVTAEPAAALRFVGRLWERTAAEPNFPALRAGLHHGEAVHRKGQWFGTSVNLAARVAAQAGGQEVLATAGVAAAAVVLGIPIVARGSVSLRNLVDPVELFAIEIAPAVGAQPIDPVCRMRVDPARATGHLRFRERVYTFCSLDCSARFAARPEAYADGQGQPSSS